MALPLIVLGAIATVVAGNAAYDYLFPDNDLPNVNNTTALSDAPPYVPPFVGAQCVNVDYRIRARWSAPNVASNIFSDYVTLRGAITSVVAINNSNSRIVATNQYGEQRALVTAGAAWVITVHEVQITRLDGGTDNCGNLPNPNAPSPPSIPTGGVPQNNTLVVTDGDQLVEGGLPVVFVPSILSALAGLAAQLGTAIANAQAAADTLAAIKATADAVDKLAKMLDAHKETLDKLRKYLNKKEKEDDANKRYLIRQYGTILRDGYLDLTPRPAPQGFKPLMLDFLCANVPNGMGRFFGINSYNWFRYQELGSICFLSPTSGVLSIHKIEHVRTSIPIPDLAIGFTYNMGLNGVIRARVSMLYTQEKS